MFWQILQDVTAWRAPHTAIIAVLAVLALLVPILAFRYIRLRLRMNLLMVQQAATLVSTRPHPTYLLRLCLAVPTPPPPVYMLLMLIVDG
jgi:hypothetical protein